MKKKTKIVTSPFAYASPWILATAIGMLIAIVFFFAANNLQREQRIMTESLSRFNHEETARQYIDLYEKMLQRPLINMF